MDNYFEEAWNPTEFFGGWFKDPLHFRQLLHDKQAIVTGSQALSFFLQTHFLKSDLDVVVPMDEVIDIGVWLIDHEGY